MNTIIKSAIFAGCLCSSLPTMAQRGNKVTFSGTAVPDDCGKNIEVWCDNDLSLIGSSRNFFVKTQNNGHFTTSFTITAPTYYFFGYNTIWLAPGDNLNGIFDNYGNKTTYTGTHAAINNYLKGTVGSHSGSYIENIGQNHLQNLTKVSQQIDSLVAVRRNELKALKVPAEFKDLEEARIKADIVNTYLSIPFYRGMDKKEEDSLLQANKAKLAPLIQAVCKDKYMNIDVVRSVISDCTHSSILKETVQWTPRMEALFTASALANYIGEQPDIQSLAEVDKFLATCKEPDIKAELQRVRQKVGNLVKGAKAPDLKITGSDGKTILMSQYKGKNIYVDMWATWCGPCMKESPIFHQLAEKYAQNKNLVFLSISIDTNTQAWKQFLSRKKSTIPEYNCVDNKGQAAWNITGIPRFILIDKDFNIINANAPAPSETDKIEAELNKLN